MKLIDITCPKCKSVMEIDRKKQEVRCKYCKNVMLIDDESKTIKIIVDKDIKNNNFIKGHSKDRSLLTNIIICLCVLVGMIFIPSLIALLFNTFISNDTVCSVIGELVFVLLVTLFYYADLKDEFITFKNDIKGNIKRGFKYYVVGLLAMIFFNFFIVMILNDVSSNENQVREMLFNSPLFSMINIVILAPLAEELTFRKSIRTVTNNKMIYAIICGVLFGLAHLLTNFISGIFVISDLLYVLPYGSLGFAFAIMDYNTDTTFTSISMHAFHNFCTGILLLIVYYCGVL